MKPSLFIHEISDSQPSQGRNSEKRSGPSSLRRGCLRLWEWRVKWYIHMIPVFMTLAKIVERMNWMIFKSLSPTAINISKVSSSLGTSTSLLRSTYLAMIV
jgi:hypothetical protein